MVKKITRVQYRYWMAGGALTTYARVLRQAQTEALQALAAHGSVSGHAATCNCGSTRRPSSRSNRARIR